MDIISVSVGFVLGLIFGGVLAVKLLLEHQKEINK